MIAKSRLQSLRISFRLSRILPLVKAWLSMDKRIRSGDVRVAGCV